MSETRKKYWTSIYYKFSDTVENAVQMYWKIKRRLELTDMLFHKRLMRIAWMEPDWNENVLRKTQRKMAIREETIKDS